MVIVVIFRSYEEEHRKEKIDSLLEQVQKNAT